MLATQNDMTDFVTMMRNIMPNLSYYPIQERWRKIKPHLQNPEVQSVLVRDMNKYTFGTWKKPFTRGMLPEQVENCDWRLNYRRPHPHFWRYVKHGACHYLVNFNLTLAQLVEPECAWRIITSDEHSTTWDGDKTLFDFNFLALGVSVQEAFRMAMVEGIILPVGKRRRVYMAEHYTKQYPVPLVSRSGEIVPARPCPVKPDLKLE